MRRLIPALAMLVVLASAAPADGSRRPTKHERDEIRAAAERHDLSCDNYPRGWCRSWIRVSTVNQHWAAEHFVPTRAGKGKVQPETATFRRRGTHWQLWMVHFACGVPPKVQRDLHLFCA